MLLFYLGFALLALVHLYACYAPLNGLRMASKPFLLLSLAIFYAVAARPVNGFVLAALLCGFVGDILLLFSQDRRYFTAGAIVFGVGHMLYATALLRHPYVQGSTAWLVLLLAALFGAAVALACGAVMPHVEQGFVRWSTPVYFGLVAFVNVAAWLVLAGAARRGASPSGAVLIVIGSLLFFASDAILAVNLFVRERPRANFYVMLPYITAQLCLCLGFIEV